MAGPVTFHPCQRLGDNCSARSLFDFCFFFFLHTTLFCRLLNRSIPLRVIVPDDDFVLDFVLFSSTSFYSFPPLRSSKSASPLMVVVRFSLSAGGRWTLMARICWKKTKKKTKTKYNTNEEEKEKKNSYSDQARESPLRVIIFLPSYCMMSF